MSELKKILETFCKLEGVRGAMVVGHDGAVQESFLEKDMDLARLAQVVSQCSTLGEKTAGDFNMEALNQSYVQYGDFSITSEMLGSRASLVILADSGANLGRIRLEIRKNRKIIEGGE
jgi:predicted regulator of Ras-like GTPase activity (Roadblock/LC7/MglB family)